METPTPSNTGKDVFLFSPIFESPEQAVAEGLCGLEQTLEERSKRSSLTSLVWDDECDFTTPYREEEEELEGYESGSSYTTIGESDSRESTPRRAEEERAYVETSVRRQGDRLLRDMLQLRRDIEMDLNKEQVPNVKEEQRGSALNDLSDLETTPGLEVRIILPSPSLLLLFKVGKAEENMLRERLELMTQQIKQEMAEELQKEKLKQRKSLSISSISESELNNSDVVINGNEIANLSTSNHATVKKLEKNDKSIVVPEEPSEKEHNDVKDNCNELSATNRHSEPVSEIASKCGEEISHPPNCDSVTTEGDRCDNKITESREETKIEDSNVNVPSQPDSNSCPQDIISDEKKLTKSRAPSVKVDTLKRKKKLKKTGSEPKPTFVEIPFCSHSQHPTGQDQASFIEVGLISCQLFQQLSFSVCRAQEGAEESKTPTSHDGLISRGPAWSGTDPP